MVQPEPKPTTKGFKRPRPGQLDFTAATPSTAKNAQSDDLEDDVVLRGVVAIDIPREVVARFSGTLILNELPERQPEIIFDPGRLLRDPDDE